MSLFWLAYRQDDVGCVLIQPAESLVSARLKACIAVPDLDVHFVGGHELGAEQDVPSGMTGRLLTADEAEQLLKDLERAIPKRGTAASVRRQYLRRGARSVSKA